MSTQLDIFDRHPHEAEFWAFHDANPQVLIELRTLALQLVKRGFKHYSIKGLYEVARWNIALRTEDKHVEWKLNNNYTAWYARMLMRSTPALAGFFETRRQRGDVPRAPIKRPEVTCVAQHG